MPQRYFDPAEMALRGRIGGHATAAKHSPLAYTGAARGVFRSSFLVGHGCSLCRPVAIPETLPEPERCRRADALRRLHYARLAHASANARRTRRTKKAAPAIETPGTAMPEVVRDASAAPTG